LSIDRRPDTQGAPVGRKGEGSNQVGYLWADLLQPAFWIAVGQIIWINILLSGDNAVVIALACRSLPPKQRFWGILLGAGAAVVLRIVFTVIIAQIMLIPFLKLIGGVLLLWIAVKLIVPSEEHGEGNVKAGDTLWRAVWLVTVADIVMSLDNVIAIAAAAETAAMRVDVAHALSIKTILIVFGLATSVPLIIAGSALLMALLTRYPILVWAGAALLGWVAGEIMIKDAAVESWLGQAVVDRWHLWAAAAGALLVVASGWAIRRAIHKRPLEHPLIVDPSGPEEFPPRPADR
jgi:YjbE family integral membrane protein